MLFYQLHSQNWKSESLPVLEAFLSKHCHSETSTPV